MEFFKLCSIYDPGMETLPYVKKVQIICGFMHAVRRRKFQKKIWRGVSGGMAKLSLNNMLAVITASGQTKPAKDYEGNTWRWIYRQVHGYKNIEPKTKHQMYLPSSVYHIWELPGNYPYFEKIW